MRPPSCTTGWMTTSGSRERSLSIFVGQAIEYEIAAIADQHSTVVAKVRKSYLPQPRRHADGRCALRRPGDRVQAMADHRTVTTNSARDAASTLASRSPSAVRPRSQASRHPGRSDDPDAAAPPAREGQPQRRLRAHRDQPLAGAIDGDLHERDRRRRESARRAGGRGRARARRARGRRGDCRQRRDGCRRADDERYRRRSVRHRPRRGQRHRARPQRQRLVAGRRVDRAPDGPRPEHDAAAGHSCRDRSGRGVRLDGASRAVRQGDARDDPVRRDCARRERIPGLGDHLARMAGQRVAAAQRRQRRRHLPAGWPAARSR